MFINLILIEKDKIKEKNIFYIYFEKQLQILNLVICVTYKDN